VLCQRISKGQMCQLCSSIRFTIGNIALWRKCIWGGSIILGDNVQHLELELIISNEPILTLCLEKMFLSWSIRNCGKEGSVVVVLRVAAFRVLIAM
jgi:hypothetical protein